MLPAVFLLEACKRSGGPLDTSDPLKVAETFLAASGDTAEGQVLLRAIDAIAWDWGEFREFEIHLLSHPTRKLVAALLEARISGHYSNLDWASAGLTAVRKMRKAS